MTDTEATASVAATDSGAPEPQVGDTPQPQAAASSAEPQGDQAQPSAQPSAQPLTEPPAAQPSAQPSAPPAAHQPTTTQATTDDSAQAKDTPASQPAAAEPGASGAVWVTDRSGVLATPSSPSAPTDHHSSTRPRRERRSGWDVAETPPDAPAQMPPVNAVNMPGHGGPAAARSSGAGSGASSSSGSSGGITGASGYGGHGGYGAAYGSRRRSSRDRERDRLRPRSPRRRPRGTTAPHEDRARLFLGNLHPDATADELRRIFEPYGALAEAPMVRRNFGFVQFVRAADAASAMRSEHGRDIRGMAVQLKEADEKRPKRGREEGELRSSDRDRDRVRDRGDRPDRDRSRPRSDRGGSAYHRPRYEARDRSRVMRVVHIAPPQRRYAEYLRDLVHGELSVGCEVLCLSSHDNITRAIAAADRDGWHLVVLVGQNNEADQTVRFNALGRGPVIPREMPVGDLVAAVARHEGIPYPPSGGSRQPGSAQPAYGRMPPASQQPPYHQQQQQQQQQPHVQPHPLAALLAQSQGGGGVPPGNLGDNPLLALLSQPALLQQVLALQQQQQPPAMHHIPQQQPPPQPTYHQSYGQPQQQQQQQHAPFGAPQQHPYPQQQGYPQQQQQSHHAPQHYQQPPPQQPQQGAAAPSVTALQSLLATLSKKNGPPAPPSRTPEPTPSFQQDAGQKTSANVLANLRNLLAQRAGSASPGAQQQQHSQHQQQQQQQQQQAFGGAQATPHVSSSSTNNLQNVLSLLKRHTKAGRQAGASAPPSSWSNGGR